MTHLDTIEDFQAIFDVIPNAIFVKNRDHQLVLLNSSACALFGRSRQVLLNTPDTELFPEDEVRVFHEADDRVFAGGLDDENEEDVTDSAGNVLRVITRKRLIHRGGQDYLVGVATDVTARREAEANNRYLAFHDILTGLPNRALLNERIDQTLLRGQQCALLYVDLDRFKEVNDELGHPAGDALIREFGIRLSGIVRASDTVARLGGDEFAILLSTADGGPDAEQVCGRILTAAGEPFAVAGREVFVSASIGVVLAPIAPVDQVELQRRADVALYEAKREGRSCWRVYTKELDATIRQRRQIEVEMREALARGTGFEVHYQPLISIPGEAVTAMEALVRWRHPRLGLLLPSAFISVAEETGLIVPLGEWVLAQACAMIVRWPAISVAVNLSPVQLRQSDLVERITAVLDRSGLPPEKLQLEVTESTMLDGGAMATNTLQALRALGIKIVLDDFGTGYSSLSHLQNLKVDKVKIDRSFVQQLGEAKDSGTIVRAVASLCRKLGISVTAEGVETDAQSRFLRASACTELQGYLFSRPLAQADAARFLDAALNTVPLAA